MAFDAGMLACVLSEIRKKALGARIEKVFQPEKDEIILQMRSTEGGKRLLIQTGSNLSRMGFTAEQKENPMTPPMLCMLLRKHLQGAKLTEVTQEGFERVATLKFETRDEMGFPCVRYLIAELMGKYSNLIFTDEDRKILAAMRTVDFSNSALRQILPGMTYLLPPKQSKRDPMEVTPAELQTLLSESADAPAEKWILSNFSGISSAVAREIVFQACGQSNALLSSCSPKRFQTAFFAFTETVKNETFSPCMILQNGAPVEYAFLPLLHYGTDFELRPFDSAGELLDTFFQTRDRENHIRRRAADILHIVSNSETRIRKKLNLQQQELEDCAKGELYKRYADLITANLYCLARGMTVAELTDYENYCEETGQFGTCTIPLDGRLSPSSNAQVYYKKYNKSKTARAELTKQIALGESELRYLETVSDALSHAENAADLEQIREELYRSGYASRMKRYTVPKKTAAPSVARFRTSGGYLVLCGKNNMQNDYITHRLAEKNDYWFHVKNLPGSHTVMLCNGEEPSERDFTEAAEIAAYFSKGSNGEHVEVDYTLVRNVKKPAGAKPGFVIYHTNWSCIVTPNASRISELREK